MSVFTIYPAIDIRGGKCVRLLKGDYGKETVYGDNPLEVAKRWEEEGAAWIHLVDLDGAREGRPVHGELIENICRRISIPVQVGGGIRTRDDVKRLLSSGVSRVILGTAAIEDRELVRSLLHEYKRHIAIGIDARDGYVATRGWLETSRVKAENLAVQLAEEGAETFIFTDISRDGTLTGPNLDAIVGLAKKCGRSVIASGGIRQTSDLLDLAAHAKDGVIGAIVGRALYTGAVQLREAILALRQTDCSQDHTMG